VGHNSLCTNHIALFGSTEQKAALSAQPSPAATALGRGVDRSPARAGTTAAMKTRAVDEGGDSPQREQGIYHPCRRAEVTVVMAVPEPNRGHKGIAASCSKKGMPASAADAPTKLGLPARTRGAQSSTTWPCPPASLGDLGMGFVNAMQVLEGGRIAMAALAVGIAQVPSTTALVYMKERRASARTLAEFKGMQA